MPSAFSLRRLPIAAILWLALALTACVSPPMPASRVPSHTLADLEGTRLGQMARRPAGLPATLDSGIRALPDALDAFTARVLLARAAERSLDVQVYIWHGDITGHLLLEELWNAAERGVRVRLLLDDQGISGIDALLAALAQHRNAEVRVFNPFNHRGRLKQLGYLVDFDRLNHRMHNKSFTADASATIVGGRNVGDEYFGASEQVLFADLDVIALGQAAHEVSSVFDRYWNSEHAYPVQDLIGRTSAETRTAVMAEFTAARSNVKALRYLAAVQAQLAEGPVPGPQQLEWVRTHLVYDDPEKVLGHTVDADLLYARLRHAIGDSRENLDLISPYFVPGEAGCEALEEAARAGVVVRIVTNSLASSDSIGVHAGYVHYRERLLRAGVHLFEFKPSADAEHLSIRKPRAKLGVISGASLHAKTFSVDHDRAFVGSFNVDPRSLRLNTELGLVVHSPTLARRISETLDQNLAGETYELRLDPAGSGLQWLEQTEQGTVVHTSEPGAGALRRVGVGLLHWLPIEWLL